MVGPHRLQLDLGHDRVAAADGQQRGHAEQQADLPGGAEIHARALRGQAHHRPIGASTWGSPDINDLGQIGYRAGFGSGQGQWLSSWCRL